MKPVNAVQIIREAMSTYGQHAATVLSVSLLIHGAALVASILAMNTLGVLGFGVFAFNTLVAQQLTNGAFAAMMASRWNGEEPGSPQEAIRPALARLGSLVGASLLFGLGVGFALLFFILPGIYLATRWAVVVPAIVVGRQRVGDAFKMSSQYTSQAMDSVFAVVLFGFLLSFLTPRLISGVAGGDTAPLEMTVIATFGISALVAPLSGLAIGELYLRLAPPASAGGPDLGRGAWVPVAQTPPAAGSGPWVPQPATAMATAPAPAPAPAPYGGGLPGITPSPYGAAPAGMAPAAYGGQAQPAYGAPAQPAAYGAPAQPAAYGTPAPHPYGAPAQPAAYGAPAPHPYGAQPAPHPSAPSAYAPAPQAAAAYVTPRAPQHTAYATPTEAPYAAPAAPQPAAYGAPAAPPYAQAPQPSAQSPMPSPGPAPVHPGREQSVGPPGMG